MYDYTTKHGMPMRLYQKILLIMRLTTVLLIASLVQVSAAGLAQKVTLSENKTVLTKVFDKISIQTGYDFLFTTTLLNNAKPVTIQVKNANLDEVLKKIFADQPFQYTIGEQSVVIKEKEPSFLERLADRWNAVDLRGVVLDEKGQPLSGANVKVKGTKLSSTTDGKGEFFLKGVGENSVLVISYIGYQVKEVAAGADLSAIKLELSLSKLDEVQVIAYGTTTQRYNVGSVTKITAEEIAQQPVGNVLQALAGRVPGLTVNQTTGLPGGAVKMQIRGQNSLRPTSGGNLPYDQPLFIIDGVPFSSNNARINLEPSLADPRTNGYPNYGISPFNMIDPGMIESIEVLRDADATSIYGSRGTNGVILITTKKGVAGKLKVNANINMGQSRVTRTMDMMNTQQYIAMRKESMKNDGIIPDIYNARDLIVFDTTKYTNWKEYFLGNTAKTIDGNTSVSGGNVNTQFLMGMGYHRETYIFPGDFSDNRLSFNSSLTHTTPDKKLTLSLNLNYAHGKNNSAGSGDGLRAFTLLPNYPDLIDPKGNLVWRYKGEELYDNPLQYLKQKYTMLSYNFISNFQISYQVLPGIFLRTNAGYNTLSSNETRLYPISSQDPAYNPKGSSNFSSNNIRTWIVEPQLELKRSIARGELNIIVGGTFQKDVNNATSINAQGYTNDELLNSLSAAATTRVTTAVNNLYKYSALFGRINYIWDKKYILNFTGRRDGSSRFGPDKRFGNFGSLGAGWIISEEPFFKKTLSFITYGKLRGSYGTTGSDAIANYLYLDNWAPKPNVNLFQGAIGYSPSNLYNSNFSWALSKKMELGVDLGFFNDRFLVNAAWFRTRSGNQLVAYSLPIQAGFTSVTKNFPATVENKGWEFSATSNNIQNSAFSWSSMLILTIPKNKLIKFPGIESSSYNDIYIVGKSLSAVRVYDYLNVDPSTGLYTFRSNNGPTSVPSYNEDRSLIVNTDPKFICGFGNTFTYKHIQFSFQLDIRRQTGVNYLRDVYSSMPVGYGFQNVPSALLKRWQKPGDMSDIQKFSADYGSTYLAGANYVQSDGGYCDASFARLKTASLSYKIDNQYIKKAKIESVRLFINAQNLLTITNYKGNDPETGSLGIPPLKTIVAGLQLNL